MQNIMSRLYGKKAAAAPLEMPKRWRPSLPTRVFGWGRDNAFKTATLLVVLLVWIAAHLYYYNRLIDMEYNVQAEWAQVESELQRRYHIQKSFTNVIVEYARHERTLMLALTELRSGKKSAPENVAGPGAAGAAEAAVPELDEFEPSELNKMFPDIVLTAEQYPALRFTENLQQVSAAIIETETRIAEHIQTYNLRVNQYTTALKQFPSNIFASVCGFEPYDFYVPDREKLVFQPLAAGNQPRPGR